MEIQKLPQCPKVTQNRSSKKTPRLEGRLKLIESKHRVSLKAEISPRRSRSRPAKNHRIRVRTNLHNVA